MELKTRVQAQLPIKMHYASLVQNPIVQINFGLKPNFGVNFGLKLYTNGNFVMNWVLKNLKTKCGC